MYQGLSLIWSLRDNLSPWPKVWGAFLFFGGQTNCLFFQQCCFTLMQRHMQAKQQKTVAGHIPHSFFINSILVLFTVPCCKLNCPFHVSVMLYWKRLMLSQVWHTHLEILKLFNWKQVRTMLLIAFSLEIEVGLNQRKMMQKKNRLINEGGIDEGEKKPTKSQSF